MTKLHKLTTTCAIALFAAAMPVAAQTADWDADVDGALTQNEFVAGFTEREVFGAWDLDDDGLLNEDELYAGTFTAYDLDGTDALEASEYEALGVDDRWGYDGWVADVEGWDVDGDGILLRNEYLIGLGKDTQLFADWDGDGDGSVSEEEFAEGVFASYDVDDDGIIGEPELADLGDDVSDNGFWDV